MLEHERIDLARHVPLLEVLGPDPAGEGVLEAALRLVAERGEPRGDLALELAVEVEQRAGLGPAEVEVVEVDEPRQLRDRLLVVVDAEVDRHVEAAAVGRALLPDADRRRLLPAPVAAGRVARRRAPAAGAARTARSAAAR